MKLLFCELLMTGLLTVSLSGCGASGTTTPVGMTGKTTGLVSLSGKTILRDGNPWVPHGFLQFGFVDPPGFTVAAGQNPIFVTSAQGYTPAEYTQMVQAGADSVRIMVAQPGIDPNGLYYSSAYIGNFVAAVHAARAAGLTVILSDQDEAVSGETSEANLPGPAAQRAWMTLLTAYPDLGQDAGILFEIYNEPFIGTGETVPTTADWTAWSTSMNALAATIRGTGAQNVFVADGLAHAEELSGAPALADPQVIYGSHPHPLYYADQNALGTNPQGLSVPGLGWNTKFGDFAANHPVLVTEWGNGFYCDNLTGTASVAFLQYLQQRGIGLTASAWDWAGPGFGSVRVDFPNSSVSSFSASGTSLCNASGNLLPGVGPGQLVQTWYKTGVPSTMLE